MTRIIVDADNCSRAVKLFLEKTSAEKNIGLVYAANKNIPFSSENPLYRMQVCPESKDAADDWIAENAGPEDIVITKDILLAKRLVDKSISAMNDMGKAFTKENIDYLVEERNLSLQMHQLGISTGGKWKSKTRHDTRSFEEGFWKILDQKKISL